MGRKLFQSVKTEVDKTTGEEVIVENTFVKEVTIDNFFQVYLEDHKGLLNLEMPEYRVLLCMIKESNFNPRGDIKGNLVNASSFYKKEWAKDCKLSIHTINNTLTSLVAKRMLFRIGRSVYQINPKYFFKGMVSDRANMIRSSVQYNIIPSEEETIQMDRLYEERIK